MEPQIRITIRHREDFAEGLAFGNTGPYLRLAGEIAFAVDPESPSYRMIVDIENAPRNDAGLVEYATDFYILRPADLSRGNRRLLYDVNNRGNLRILQFFNDAVHSNAPLAVEHAGNGFLMRRGYSLVWSGWQGDLLPGDGRMTMRVPTATEQGNAVTGVTRAEFVVDDAGVTCMPLSANDHTASYAAASADTGQATFTMRQYERDPRQPISSDAWQFAKLDETGEPTPSAFHCYLPKGFKPGWIYELVYTAREPLVLGLGFTGVRDLVSFLMHDPLDNEGSPNPLRHDGVAMDRAYAWGRSQSGRFLREFVYRGYNEDARGGRVFDAVSPHVSGGGRIVLNYRFGQPGRFPRQHEDHLYPSDQFPFAYPVMTDPHPGASDGILKRPHTDPLVMHTQTSAEYWERRGSLVHTSPLGDDVPDHPSSRVYLFSGSQHGADPLQGAQTGTARHATNPLNTTPLLRALLDAMDGWATDGKAPPDSRVPVRGDETAVPADVASAVFPKIPGVDHPDEPSRLYLQDHGPRFDSGILDNEPPQEDLKREYTVFVPQVDSDGNEVPGVRTPHVQVPLSTYTGWNYRRARSSGEALAGLTGSYLPMPRTSAERAEIGDPRPSVQERYGATARYVRLVALAAQRLVDQRLLLEEDADRYVEQAMTESI